MAQIAFSENQEYGSWRLISRHSSGGNSSVWIVEHVQTGEKQIIKLLRKTHDTAKQRFKDEIKIISENQDNEGVMKLIDTSPDSEVPWYVMPKSETLNKYLESKLSTVVIDAVLKIAKVLSPLHAKGVSHRDIKPQNLFHRDGLFIIGDFGLVDYPDKVDGLTIQGNSLGPRWTIAPEMRNNPESAEGIKADVYSLSKTLWILLTAIEKGFEGQYSPTGSIGLIHYNPDLYLPVLEELLVRSTENDPNLRPTIDEFIEILENWVELQENWQKKNSLDWQIVQNKLFPLNSPTYAEWIDINDICSILNIVGGIKSLNHAFFSDYGGMDLEGAQLSTREPGCLELDFGSTYLVKPKRLMFCSFNNDTEWNYFYCEFDKLVPIFEEWDEDGREEVLELESGEYKSWDFVEYYYEKYDDGYNYVPTNYRKVNRCSGGSIVIFRKTSSYNRTPSTYDGRHAKMGSEKFREYIQDLVDIGYKVTIVRDDDGKPVGKHFTHEI